MLFKSLLQHLFSISVDSSVWSLALRTSQRHSEVSGRVVLVYFICAGKNIRTWKKDTYHTEAL